MPHKVLFVDDDPNMCASFRRRLRHRHPVETAASGFDGLSLLRERGPFAVIVTDYCMPGMNGIDFLVRAREVSPDTVRMLLTGSADLNAAIQAVNRGQIYRFLTKPCRGDEIECALADGIAEYRRIHRERKYNRRARRLLAQAEEVQNGLRPLVEGALDGLDIAGRSVYVDQTGGDYYDFFKKPTDSGSAVVIAVGDVSDHGPASALLMAGARAFIRECALQPGSAAEVVSRVNRRLCRDTQTSGRFMTLFYAEIDPATRTLRWVRAGHPPALVLDRRQGDFGELRGEGGLPLGVLEEATYAEGCHRLAPGQLIAIATDGILDACDPQGVRVGWGLIRKEIAVGRGLPAAEIVLRCLEGLAQRLRPAALDDDATLVVVKVEG